MGPSKCGACSRTKLTKNTFAQGATALFPRALATLCVCRVTPQTFAVTGTRAAGNDAAERLRCKLRGALLSNYCPRSSKIDTVPLSS